MATKTVVLRKCDRPTLSVAFTRVWSASASCASSRRKQTNRWTILNCAVYYDTRRVDRHNSIVSVGGGWTVEVNRRKRGLAGQRKVSDTRVLSWRRRFILTQGGPRWRQHTKMSMKIFGTRETFRKNTRTLGGSGEGCENRPGQCPIEGRQTIKPTDAMIPSERRI